MFFAKIKLSDGVIIKANVEFLDLSAVCPICGKEFPIDTQEYFDAWDGEVHCEDCTKQMKPFIIQHPERDYYEYNWLKLLTQSEYPSNLFTWALRHAPSEALNAAADQFMAQVPGHHEDKPLGDLIDELERRAQEV